MKNQEISASEAKVSDSDSTLDYAILELSDAEPWTEKFERETTDKKDCKKKNIDKKKAHNRKSFMSEMEGKCWLKK